MQILVEACVVVLLSATVTTLTALSMSAISTNGLVKGGKQFHFFPYKKNHFIFFRWNLFYDFEIVGA